MNARYSLLTGFAFILFSSMALAHPGHGADHSHSSFLYGLLHPLTGLDHLAMLLGIGALGAWQSTKQRIQLYTGTLGIMFAGAVMGLITGFASGIEAMILASMFLIAVGLFFSLRGLLPMLAALVLVMFHGWAHGLEMPAGGVLTFMPGMLMMAALIMAAGYALGKTFQPKWLGIGSGVAAVLISVLG